MATQQLKDKVEELRSWYNARSRELGNQEEKMAAVAGKARTRDAKLTEQEAQLNAKAKDLAAREQALRTKDLEDSQKKAIDSQAQDAAAKLKEVTNNLAAASEAKTGLEIRMGKLEEELAGNKKEIEALREEARKAASTLEGLQSQLSSKDQDLNTASSTIEDLNAKLATLEKDLEQAKDQERVLTEEFNTSRNLRKDAELKDQVDLYNLWSKSSTNIAERISSQIAKMNMEC
nr:tropomyosin-2-like [Aegilops tauschii subsp. strangulata]